MATATAESLIITISAAILYHLSLDHKIKPLARLGRQGYSLGTRLMDSGCGHE